jgi:hypothetical protein
MEMSAPGCAREKQTLQCHDGDWKGTIAPLQWGQGLGE